MFLPALDTLPRFTVRSGSFAAGTWTLHSGLTLRAALDLASDEYKRPHAPDVEVQRADGHVICTLIAG